jgi:hypothetical protein
MSDKLTKKLARAGITTSSDGLLRDLVGRGHYKAAIDVAEVSIRRRENECEVICQLIDELRKLT